MLIYVSVAIWVPWWVLVRQDWLARVPIDLRRVVFVWIGTAVLVASFFGREGIEPGLFDAKQQFLIRGPDRRVFDIDTVDPNPILLGECPSGRPDGFSQCVSVRLLSASKDIALFHVFGFAGLGRIGELNLLGEPLVRAELRLSVGCSLIMSGGERTLKLTVLESARRSTWIGAELVQGAEKPGITVHSECAGRLAP